MLSDVEPWNAIAPSTNRGAVEGGGGNRKVVAVRERNGPLDDRSSSLCRRSRVLKRDAA